MKRYPIDVPLVRRLLADQFPQWAELPVRLVARGGWDNRTFRLGDDKSVRLPSAAPYAQAVDKEHRWLPVLAPRLPLPIPAPLARGRPGAGYPQDWSVYGWIDGEPASATTIADPGRFARDLAGFLLALRDIDPAGGPEPGVHNWLRGGPLQAYDDQTRAAIEQLGERIPRRLATRLWEDSLAAQWTSPPVWFHGDVAAGNLLVRDGRLAAVIDFGTTGVGDPACDLAIAWTLLRGRDRAVYREALAADDAMWARGRGWALWKALITYDESGPVLDEIFNESGR